MLKNETFPNDSQQILGMSQILRKSEYDVLYPNTAFRNTALAQVRAFLGWEQTFFPKQSSWELEIKSWSISIQGQSCGWEAPQENMCKTEKETLQQKPKQKTQLHIGSVTG